MNLNADISSLPAHIRRNYKQLQVLHAEKQIQNKAKNDFLSFFLSFLSLHDIGSCVPMVDQ